MKLSKHMSYKEHNKILIYFRQKLVKNLKLNIKLSKIVIFKILNNKL